MERRFSFYCLVAILLAFPAIAYSNDAPVVLLTGTVVPVVNSKVQLVRETINVKCRVDDPNASKRRMRFPFPDDAEVEAILVFLNPNSKDVVQMIGFPLDLAVSDDENYENYPTSSLSFQAFSDGKKISHHTYVDTASPDLLNKRTWFVWEQTFPADSETVIKHNYKLPMWGGNHIEPSIYNLHYFQYILSTGALWAGQIEKCTVEIHFDKPLNPNWYYSVPIPTVKKKRYVKWEYSDLEPSSEISFVYSWAEDKAKIFSFLEKLDERASTESKAIENEMPYLKFP